MGETRGGSFTTRGLTRRRDVLLFSNFLEGLYSVSIFLQVRSSENSGGSMSRGQCGTGVGPDDLGRRGGEDTGRVREEVRTGVER